MCAACVAHSYSAPTPVQKVAIPPYLAGRDVVALAQTGSGKTAAFALPILQDLLLRSGGSASGAQRQQHQPQEQQQQQEQKQQQRVFLPFACILAPTRELALQNSQVFERLGAMIGLRVAVVVGGMDTMSQAIVLARRPHVVVGSPGRILYHLEHTKGFSLRGLRHLVLDEADRLLHEDFGEQIERIMALIPTDRQSFMCSATMTNRVEKLQRATLRNPVRVHVDQKYATVDSLVQHFVFVPALRKDCYLVFLVLSEFSGQSTIVFAERRRDAHRLALLLRNLGLGAIPLHGEMTQAKRFAALGKFAAQRRAVLVATGVASRGLDLPKVDVVINYDVPLHPKDYIHRVGRTARGQRAGRAVTLVSQYDVEIFQRIERSIGKKLDELPLVEDEVLVLMERVAEARRFVARQIHEEGRGGKHRGRGGRQGRRRGAGWVTGRGGGGGGGGGRDDRLGLTIRKRRAPPGRRLGTSVRGRGQKWRR